MICSFCWHNQGNVGGKNNNNQSVKFNDPIKSWWIQTSPALHINTEVKCIYSKIIFFSDTFFFKSLTFCECDISKVFYETECIEIRIYCSYALWFTYQSESISVERALMFISYWPPTQKAHTHKRDESQLWVNPAGQIWLHYLPAVTHTPLTPIWVLFPHTHTHNCSQTSTVKEHTLDKQMSAFYFSTDDLRFH